MLFNNILTELLHSLRISLIKTQMVVNSEDVLFQIDCLNKLIKSRVDYLGQELVDRMHDMVITGADAVASYQNLDPDVTASVIQEENFASDLDTDNFN